MRSRAFLEGEPSVPRGSPTSRRRWIVGLAALLSYSLLLPLSAADSPLSFNLQRSEDRTGDFPLVFYTFRCGSKAYTFCPPAGWTIMSDATGMSFSKSAGGGDAVARFRVSSPAELGLLNPSLSGRREPALRKYLPAGYRELHQLGVENSNPLPVFGREGAEVVYSYDFYGRSLKVSVLICQLDETNGFTLVTTASAEDWDAFSAEVRRTLGAVSIVEDRFGSDLL